VRTQLTPVLVYFPATPSPDRSGAELDICLRTYVCRILVAIGVLLAITGALGFVSCYKRMLSGMLFTELMLVMIFIILYIAFVVAFLMAVGAQSPVDKGVDSAWNQGMRRDLFEKDTPGDRWCRLNTDLVGPCKRFYNKAGEAVRRSQQGTLSSCNMSVTEMALDCPSAERTCRTSNQPKNIGKFGRECTLCDLECKAAVKTKIKDALDPAVLGNWVLFAILVIDVMLINFLLGETLRMRSHVMFGYALNTLIFVTCMVVVLFLGVVISRMEGGCSASVDCTSWSIAGSFIIVFGLMIISAVAVFGLWSENDLVLRLANFLFILSGFLLLLVAIVLAMASGAISDVNAYYEEHWPDVRDELNHNGYCDDLDCLAHNGTWVRTGEGSYGAPVGKCSLHPVPHPKSPNVEIDPCVSRIEAATEEEAVSICAVASVVVLGMMATIYFNFRGIKQLSKLGDYQDGVMGEITETRAAMMAEQAKVLAERNKLESKINAER
jgi:hypothetical protein